MGRERRVGGDDDDDRALLAVGVLERLARGVGPNLLADGHARHDELPAPAVVGLHQDPDRVAALSGRHDARGGADAALEAVADHARPAAHRSFGNRAAFGRVERGEHVLVLHVEAVDVVQIAVVGLGHHRQRPPVAGRVGRARADPPADDRVAHHAHAVRVGDHDRALEKSRLLDPRGARHLAVAVLREPAGKRRLRHRVSAARQHGGDARADGSFANDERALTLDDRRVTDGDAGHVGDGIERAGRAGERHAQIARPPFGRLRAP